MTRKHFDAIATEINRAYRLVETPGEGQILRITIGNLSESFAKINPRFDRWKFYDACTVIDK